MKLLVIGEYANDKLSDATAKVVSAASSVAEDIHVLLTETDSAITEQAASIEGVSKVLSWEVASQQAESLAPAIAEIAQPYDAVWVSSSSFGKDVLPRVAALLDVMQVSDVVEVVDSKTFVRPIYAGNALQTVRSHDDKQLCTIRASSFSAANTSDAPNAQIETIQNEQPEPKTRHIGTQLNQSERPELTSAEIVVSGGRGIGSEGAFQRILMPFADELGAAVGASRAAVDSGFAPNDWQVGQTGKIVAPDFYFAVGLSGAIQHIAGMKDSGVIVAINKDPEAPIFEVADYGLCGDLFEILPQLQAELKAQ
ncbi:Electron transfer flavoprotein subunit alpha [Vibrio nigripulchritudo SFn27]|uniref:Electron transfer flavoprotein subunit alpha n=1 Tax=Vibrio nigripulchritudo TaxID=28173 RepID=U4K4R7_9VIBR|nr:electron transfer flavoprotein subunit alpha/FixB family protein [Vibrio nigripulchritudo]CCN82429.1 Electron transfer flavoprotein subunit alpha [Vibrio nigripulchritudo BLFn1]CCN91415.1 Electron transfer flavoprotein subunit alpha [Vibrio nigripulchritudo SFn27]CCN97580.1 Electron transfer flavoprotein subunit alpha [Vibrio nigripulchritudo ENn2]CCO38722.1 Electron transfer flavoprotein subunit alpha [Vibrio nigripulchritudo SFn135]CCO55127.1 Electron transfer flavoprotein subunit alpha [